MPRARCCSTCTALPGTTICSKASTSRRPYCRRSATPATISGRLCRSCSAARADPRQRLYFVPAFTGLGAPWWSPAARGTLTGLTAECGLPEIARAALEAVGYQTRDLIAAMASDAGLAIDRLRVDGGMAVSDWTMQFLADIVPAVIERPASVETTAWGAAYAAGLTRGLCPEPEAMIARWTPERRFTPAMSDGEREERYEGWRRAVSGALAMAGP